LAIPGLVIAGMLFLPERVSFDPPGLPGIGKGECVTLLALLGVLVWDPRRLFLPLRNLRVEFLFVPVSICAFATAMTNGDVLLYGPTRLSALSAYDGLAVTVSYVLAFALPFYLGRLLVRRPGDLSDLFKVLVAAGVLYSLFILVELRMSPQFHDWVYGFHQAPFHHTYRFGGYRPMVFMPNGLSVAVLIAVAGVAARGLGRAKLGVFSIPVKSGMISHYLLVILILCKSTGAALIGLVFNGMVAVLRRRTLARVLLLLTVLVIIYPFARLTGVFPAESVVSAARVVSERRAHSLEFRFKHEDQLAEKARERFLFGWGGYGRAGIYHEITGRDLSTTDSQWILWLTRRGVITMSLLYAVLYLPVLVAIRRLPRMGSASSQTLVLSTAAMIVIYLLDALVNAVFVTFPYFLAGALMGAASAVPRRARRAKRVPPSSAGAPGGRPTQGPPTSPSPGRTRRP
jgi:hypothetical protein